MLGCVCIRKSRPCSSPAVYLCNEDDTVNCWKWKECRLRSVPAPWLKPWLAWRRRTEWGVGGYLGISSLKILVIVVHTLDRGEEEEERWHSSAVGRIFALCLHQCQEECSPEKKAPIVCSPCDPLMHFRRWLMCLQCTKTGSTHEDDGGQWCVHVLDISLSPSVVYLENVRRALLGQTTEGPSRPALWTSKWSTRCSREATQEGHEGSSPPLLWLPPATGIQICIFSGHRGSILPLRLIANNRRPPPWNCAIPF